MKLSIKVLQIATFSVWISFSGLATAQSSYPDHVGPPVHANEIVASFKRIMEPGDWTIFYDNNLLASISVYGRVGNSVAWIVDNEILSCSEFETARHHLTVKSTSSIYNPVEMLTCHYRW